MGFKAFVPNPLPPSLEWDNQLVNSLSRADFLLGKLAREGARLPNPHLFTRSFITREAVLSSRIEGTRASIGEVLAHGAGLPVKQDQDDIQEVQNYIVALDFALKRLETLPLSLRLIKEIHHYLMQGVRGAHATPGEFRKTQNWIGLPGCTLNTAKFVPPPVEHLMESLNQFEKFLHDRQLPALVHIALCHYQFEAIHPFLDGNGRIGRLLISLLLMEQDLLSSPLLYLSAFFEATREEYYRQLYNVSREGTWKQWLLYFLNGIALQSQDVLSRAERLNMLLSKWRKAVAGSGSKIAEVVVDELAVTPYITAKNISHKLDIAFSTAQRAIKKLESTNILKPVNEAKRDRVYCAFEILNILEEPAIIQAGLGPKK